ncbi:MAG: PilZ domain-containing protein [Candidatus Omnitrophica bacterium]|nr:PilZ domain-containing protein [Candidatus Omnitrophota bacterium]
MNLFFKREHWESGIAVLEESIFSSETAVTSDSLIEKRGTSRVSMSVPVDYRILEEDVPFKRGRTMNLSENGARLMIPAVVTIGSWIEIKIKVSDSAKPVRVRGVVVWVVPSFSTGLTSCGIAFEDLKRVSRKEKLIAFIADKICQLALESTSKLVCRPAETLEELKSAYRLVYKEYLARGYCQPNPSQMQYNFFSVLPGTCTFILKGEDKLFGTISLIVDSPCGLPMESLFPKEIGRFRAQGRRLAEVGLLALDLSAIGKTFFSLTSFQKQACLFRLFKLMFDHARFVAGVTDLVIGMHPKHETLYRYLTFERIGAVRSYEGACGKPALPMRMDIPRTVASISQEEGKGSYFIRHTTPKETLETYYRFTPETVHELLMETRPLWEKLPETARVHLKSCYPDS